MPAWHPRAPRMLGWLRDNYKLGVRFHSSVINSPCIFYGSGHGQCFSDSKTHHGNIAVFAGGSVGNESKEHDDLGDSTRLNEYMACYHAARKARWWYQFIQELDNVTAAKDIEPIFAYLIKDPIILYYAPRRRRLHQPPPLTRAAITPCLAPCAQPHAWRATRRFRVGA